MKFGLHNSGESGTDVIQASGQASWADLIWIKVLKHMEW